MIQILQYFNICSFIYKQILLLIPFNSAAIDHFGFECVNPSNFGFVIAIGFPFGQTGDIAVGSLLPVTDTTHIGGPAPSPAH